MAKLFINRWLKDKSLFLTILGIGLFFRILFMLNQGFGNDELSAWHRTNLFDWNSFWHEGVKAGDMHPAFYQVLLWFWVRIFGDSEIAIRSTSILFYIANSFLIFSICSRFFTKRIGLSIVSIYAGLTFFIINTVFARPYNSGTFFLLLLFFSILNLAHSEKVKFKWFVLLSIGFLGAMLSHYFAFLTAGMIGVLGFGYLILKDESKKMFNKKSLGLIGASIVAIICFLPHLPITLFQLNQGGLGWLPPPKWNWLGEVFLLISNKSYIVSFGLIIGLIAITRKEWFRKQLIESYFAFSIFVLTYVVGHLLSLYYTPILRELVTLFMIPFLLIFLFSGVNQIQNENKFKTLIIALPLILGLHSVFSNNLLKPYNFGVFKEISEKTDEYRAIIPKGSYEIKSNFNNESYINYYLKEDIREPIKNWADGNVVYELNDLAKKSKKEYFFYNWSNSYHIPMYYEVIRNYFPNAMAHEDYFSSAFSLFKKNEKRKLRLINEELGIKSIQATQTNEEFFGGFEFEASKFLDIKKNSDYILVKSKGILFEQSTLNFVAVLERDGALLIENEIPFLYQAYDQSRLVEIKKPTEFFMAFDLPEKTLKTDKIKVYFWNPNKKKCAIEGVNIYLVDPNF